MPASTSTSPRALAMAGVMAAALSTTVLPKAKAGAIFQAGIAMGKFQGVISLQTPRGYRLVADSTPTRTGRPFRTYPHTASPTTTRRPEARRARKSGVDNIYI